MTASSRTKWVKPCRTVPGSIVHSAAAGALCVASSIVQGSARHGVDGTSVMPPSRPFSGRRRSSTAPSGRINQNATPYRDGRSAFLL
jgi:hypothetical protein